MSEDRSFAGVSWIEQAGYVSVQRLQDWIITIGALPFIWFVSRRDFSSRGFLWADILFLSAPTLATVWAALRIRCSACGMPVYAMWLLGHPRKQKRYAFQRLPCCPYCLDDGTGKTVEVRPVDRKREIWAAVRFGGSAILLFIAVILAVVGLMAKGWFPGYRRSHSDEGNTPTSATSRSLRAIEETLGRDSRAGAGTPARGG